VGWLHGGTVTVGIGYFPGSIQKKVPMYPPPIYIWDVEESALLMSVMQWAPRWMELYSPCIENLKLTEMTLGGSHDSGTYVRDQLDVITQSLNIEDQLMSGVRVLDLRIRQDHSNLDRKDQFFIGHGVITFDLKLSDVLEQVVSFLKKTDKEIVILDFHEFRGTWSALDLSVLTQLLFDYLRPYLISRSYANSTVGEIWKTPGRVVACAFSGVLGNVYYGEQYPITDQEFWWMNGVEQMYQGTAITTWSNVTDYMDGVLAETTRPWDHLWSLQTGYYIGYGASWIPTQVSNYFSFENGLKSNIVSMDWWRGVSPLTRGLMQANLMAYPNPNSNFSPLIVGVPLNILKGYRKSNNLAPWEGGKW